MNIKLNFITIFNFNQDIHTLYINFHLQNFKIAPDIRLFLQYF